MASSRTAFRIVPWLPNDTTTLNGSTAKESHVKPNGYSCNAILMGLMGVLPLIVQENQREIVFALLHAKSSIDPFQLFR